MLKKTLVALFFHLICVLCIHAQTRAFDEIFPGLGTNERSDVFNESGYIKTFSKGNRADLKIGNNQSVGIDPSIINAVLSINPGYLVESISVIPLNQKEATLLDIYNALGNIRQLKGKLYNSYTRKQLVPLFEDATRIASDRQTTPIPDPPPSKTLPAGETVFIKLKDVNFGNTYYRGDVKLFQSGLCYTLTNIRNLSYLFVPVIREGNFIALLYIEPVKEGVLIYGFAGVNISDFFASKISVNSAISKRLAVITYWAADGIQKQ